MRKTSFDIAKLRIEEADYLARLQRNNNRTLSYVYKTTGDNKFVRGRWIQLVWGRGVIKDTTYLLNITDKILLYLKFELTQIHFAR